MAEATPEAKEKFRRLIEGCGVNDKYIDAEEEGELFQTAEKWNISKGLAEALINHRCRHFGWTRETDIAYYLSIMLEEMTKDDGVIDKTEFDHVIGFAVKMRMPRKNAIKTCCKIIREHGWATKNDGLLKRHNWLDEYEASGD
jgi:hypothetical protein